MKSMNEPRDKNGLTEKEFLAAYKPGNWPRPSCTADLAIIYEAPDLTREILLIKPETRAGDDARDAEWFGIASEPGDNSVKFTLTSGDISMGFSASYETIDSGFGASQVITGISGDGLAFDHAKLVALALLKSEKR